MSENQRPFFDSPVNDLQCSFSVDSPLIPVVISVSGVSSGIHTAVSAVFQRDGLEPELTAPLLETSWTTMLDAYRERVRLLDQQIADRERLQRLADKVCSSPADGEY